MIGLKVDIKAYQAKGKTKKQNPFSIEETLLSHYDTISMDAKKIAKSYFKENIHEGNGLLAPKIEHAIKEYLFEIKAKVPFQAQAQGGS